MEITKRCMNVFEVSMTPKEFYERYQLGMEIRGVMERMPTERVEQARTTFGLAGRDMVLGQHEVY